MESPISGSSTSSLRLLLFFAVAASSPLPLASSASPPSIRTSIPSLSSFSARSPGRPASARRSHELSVGRKLEALRVGNESKALAQSKRRVSTGCQNAALWFETSFGIYSGLILPYLKLRSWGFQERGNLGPQLQVPRFCLHAAALIAACGHDAAWPGSQKLLRFLQSFSIIIVIACCYRYSILML